MNENTIDPKQTEAELAAKADLAEDRAGEEMARTYRDALAKYENPELATAAAMDVWLFGRDRSAK